MKRRNSVSHVPSAVLLAASIVATVIMQAAMQPVEEQDRAFECSKSSSQPSLSVKARVKCYPRVKDVRKMLAKTSRTGHLRMSSDSLATMFERIENLLASQRYLSTHPYAGAGYHAEWVTHAGRNLCSDHEQRLVELETVIDAFAVDQSKVKYMKLSKADRASALETTSASANDLQKYKRTIKQIILDNVNSSGSSLENGSSKRQHVTIQPTNDVEVNPSFKIKTSRLVISETIVRHTDNELESIMVWHSNKETLAEGHVSSSTYSQFSLYFEMAGQMCAGVRHTSSDTLTHQGVMFNGFSATVMMLSVETKTDLLGEHKAHMAQAHYSMPYNRPGFIFDMVKLLSRPEDYRQVFTYEIANEVYNADSREFELQPGRPHQVSKL